MSEPATVVRVPASRFGRWVANFSTRHGPPELSVSDAKLHGLAPSGAWFVAQLPLQQPYKGEATVSGFQAAWTMPAHWGLLVVRRGAYGMAHIGGEEIIASKIERRYVQGRTKAGGQSQQRFARRRGNQARRAYAAAGQEARRVLATVPLIVTGGDRSGVAEVRALLNRADVEYQQSELDLPEPRYTMLLNAIEQLSSATIWVHNG